MIFQNKKYFGEDSFPVFSSWEKALPSAAEESPWPQGICRSQENALAGKDGNRYNSAFKREFNCSDFTECGVNAMGQEPGSVSVSPVAKKGILISFLVIAAVILLLFLFAKGGAKGPKIISEGDHAPEFTLPSPDGKTISLSTLRGSVVMIHFWATWCPSCIEEMPTLEKLYQGLSGSDFEVLAVNVDENGSASVETFLRRNSLTLPVLFDPGGQVAKQYGTFKLPETYILDRNGIVTYKVIGPHNWTDPATVKALQDMLGAR